MKLMNQSSFDWYIQDSSGLWHFCRENKVDNAYTTGHEKPAKTPNHQRHASCKSAFLIENKSPHSYFSG